MSHPQNEAFNESYHEARQEKRAERKAVGRSIIKHEKKKSMAKKMNKSDRSEYHNVMKAIEHSPHLSHEQKKVNRANYRLGLHEHGRSLPKDVNLNKDRQKLRAYVRGRDYERMKYGE